MKPKEGTPIHGSDPHHTRLGVKKLDHAATSSVQGPRTPKGGCTGVLVYEIEGRGPFFAFGGMATYTPQKYMYAQSTQLVERITMVLSRFYCSSYKLVSFI